MNIDTKIVLQLILAVCLLFLLSISLIFNPAFKKASSRNLDSNVLKIKLITKSF